MDASRLKLGETPSPLPKEHIMENYERVKKWREQNKDKHQKQWLSYYQRHKEEILTKRKLTKLTIKKP